MKIKIYGSERDASIVATYEVFAKLTYPAANITSYLLTGGELMIEQDVGTHILDLLEAQVQRTRTAKNGLVLSKIKAA